MDAALSDLCGASKKAVVSHKSRNNILNKMLAEHSADGSCEQLKRLWTQWVADNNMAEPDGGKDGRLKWTQPPPPWLLGGG